MSERYLKKDRLADVLALIQVLALDHKPHRSEEELRQELQGEPRSAASWTAIGKQHPEFFRVREDKKHPLSLIARHVTPEVDDQRILPDSLVETLLHVAVEMHDREAKRRDRWFQITQTVIAGIVGGLISYIPRLIR